MKDPLNVKLGQSIRKARLKKGWSMMKLAGETDLSTNYIGNIERGEKSLTVKVLVKVAKALGHPPEEWIKGL